MELSGVQKAVYKVLLQVRYLKSFTFSDFFETIITQNVAGRFALGKLGEESRPSIMNGDREVRIIFLQAFG